MCWNEPVSWITFVLGTLFNVYMAWHFRTKTIYAFAVVIQWVLLMQLFEALAWRDQNCGKLNKFATQGAMLANITQPLIVFLAFIIIGSNSTSVKLTAGTIAFAYTCYLLWVLGNHTGNFTCITPSTACSHLDLNWWKVINPLIYCIALFSLMLLLIRPMGLAYAATAYVAVTLALSMMFYSCGAGSMWCWFATASPLLILALYKP